MGKFKRSWELTKGSWAVLREDKELLLLPVMAFIATVITAATFFVPIFFTGRTSTIDGGSEFSLGPVGYVLTFAAYIVLAYVTIFFNAALVHAANERMSGGDPTLGSALRGAAARGLVILPWAVVSATVSIVLRAISERSGLLGKIIVGFVGVAWSLVTFLVLPILVIEGIGVGEAIKRSSSLFKRTWGEQVIANAGIGIVSFIAILAGLPLLALIATGITALAISGIALFVIWVALVAVVTSARSVIYQTALYRFAVGDQAPAGFGGIDLRSSFQPKH